MTAAKSKPGRKNAPGEKGDYERIRELVKTWHRAAAAGDLEALLPLMAEDVVFLAPGQPPMRGREGFAESFRKLQEGARLESSAKFQEIQVSGELAYCWTQLAVAVVPKRSGATLRRVGPALTVLRKEDDRWVVFRDANLLAPER